MTASAEHPAPAAAAGLSRRIAEHVATIGFDALPTATVAAARRSLIDGLGVMLAATTLGEGTDAFADLALEMGGAQASLIGRGRRASLTGAALANGALAHAIDFEDSHDRAPVHPNAVLLAAVLPFAEAMGSVSGRDMLAAIAVGCDLTVRLGQSLCEDPTKFGWYPPPILGGFGAIAACARLARLTPDQIVDAFSLLLCSTTCSAELKYSPDSQVRAVRDAFPAQAAVQAVLLARRGVRGFDAPLEGKAGFFALYVRGAYAPETLLDGLGTRFAGDELSYKPWPSCRGTHPFIETILHLRATENIGVADVAAIRLTGHPILKMLDEPHDQKRRPATAIDAKFSLPFTVATALVDGAVTLESFSHDALPRDDIAEAAKRVSFAGDPSMPADALARGSTEIELRDGRVLRMTVVEARGHPSNPLSDDDLADKFRACAAYAAVPLPDDEIERLIETISRFEHCADAGAALFGA